MKGKRTLEFPRVATATFWYPNGKKARIYPGTKTKRLYYKLRGRKWEKVYFRINYGMAKTSSGKKEMFYNSGTYTNVKEAIYALRAFLESP